jgi:hypothetical protein
MLITKQVSELLHEFTKYRDLWLYRKPLPDG